MGRIAEIIKSKQCPGITGTRDNFGIGKSFIDERTGKEIDNWKSWERAGYSETGEIKNNKLKEMVKEKKEKRRNRRDKKLDNRSLPI